MTDERRWQEYERVSRYLLDAIAREIGMERVEGKQILPGLKTGTEWEIDAKGILQDGTGFVVIECRRTRKRQSQDKVAALAFTIDDTGAQGGLIVSPLPLQRGAKAVAAAARITHVQIDALSTEKDFAVRFLDHLFLGASAGVSVSATAIPTVHRTCVACAAEFEAIETEKVCSACMKDS